MNTDQVLESLRKHSQTLRTDFRIVRLGLVGSFARGEQAKESDIDLLAEFEPGTDDLFDKKMKLRDQLRASCHREVDICRKKCVQPHRKSRLLKEAICVCDGTGRPFLLRQRAVSSGFALVRFVSLRIARS